MTELDNLIVASELQGEQVELLRTQSMGFFTFPDYLSFYKREQLTTGYSLGIECDELWGVSYGLDLEEWRSGYKLMGVSTREINHTHKFLERLTFKAEPIAFFVPSQLFSHPEAQYTRAEFEWFLRSPEDARFTSFVFGMYDYFKADQFKDLPPNYPERIFAIRDFIYQHLAGIADHK